MYQTYFKEIWLDEAKYTDWLFLYKNKNVEVDKTHAYCKHCKFAMTLSNMGLGALNSHFKGKGHQQLVNKFQCFFKTSNNKTRANKKEEIRQ